MIKSITYSSFLGDKHIIIPQTEAMIIAKKSGFEAFEILFGDGEYFDLNTDKKTALEFLELAKKNNIKLSSFNTVDFFKFSFSSPFLDEVERANKSLQKMLELAVWMNIEAILVVPGVVENLIYPDRPIISYDIVYEKSFEVISKFKSQAESLGITLCIENVWNRFFLSPLELRDFIDKINSQFVGAYLDVGNVLSIGYPEHWIKILGKRIKRIHLKDFKKEIGNLNGFCDLLEGDVNFCEVIKALRSINYDSYLTAEVGPFKEGLIEKTSKAIDKIMKM